MIREAQGAWSGVRPISRIRALLGWLDDLRRQLLQPVTSYHFTIGSPRSCTLLELFFTSRPGPPSRRSRQSTLTPSIHRSLQDPVFLWNIRLVRSSTDRRSVAGPLFPSLLPRTRSQFPTNIPRASPPTSRFQVQTSPRAQQTVSLGD